MAKEKQFGLFDWLNEITLKKSPWESFNEDQIKVFNSFMIHKYISMCPDYIELVNYVQKIPYDNKKQIYSIYKEMIPKRKVYLKYVGAKKKKSNSELMEHISKYYCCSLKEADEYIDILGIEGIKNILPKMGIEEKEIKKLIK